MTLHRLTQLLSALSNETRVKIFFYVLESGEPLHSAMIAGLCDIRETLASYHLKTLTDAGWLVRVPSGKHALFIADRRVVYEVVTFFYQLVPEPSKPPPAQMSDYTEEGFFEETL